MNALQLQAINEIRNRAESFYKKGLTAVDGTAFSQELQEKMKESTVEKTESTEPISMWDFERKQFSRGLSPLDPALEKQLGTEEFNRVHEAFENSRKFNTRMLEMIERKEQFNERFGGMMKEMQFKQLQNNPPSAEKIENRKHAEIEGFKKCQSLNIIYEPSAYAQYYGWDIASLAEEKG